MTANSEDANVNTARFSDLVMTLAEDALFALAARGPDIKEAMDGLGKRRMDAYAAFLQGTDLPRLTGDYERWLVECVKAMATVAPPRWLPMHEVLDEKVTLEVGARGIRSLFSSKPSEKDTARVKRLGGMAARVLRAVFAADAAGQLDREEQLMMAAFIASLGLSAPDANALLQEAARPLELLDVYGDVERPVADAMLRGAWFAAASDAIDPREEDVIRMLAQKLSLPPHEVEAARTDAIARVEARRTAGAAVVDGVRYILADRVPRPGARRVASMAGTLMLPRRYRNEVLAPIEHGADVTLARRYPHMPADDRAAVLGMTWAVALSEDPTVSRKTVLRWRYDRFAIDLGEDGIRPRVLVDEFVSETLAAVVRTMSSIS